MRKAYLFFICSLAFISMATAQVPEQVLFTEDDETVRGACVDQYAGTITRGPFTGSSNDNMLDRIFLCWQDNFRILHNNDEDLTGDPVPATPGGIGYIFYECAPSVSGPDTTAIFNDPCVLDDPPSAQGAYVFVDNPNGNALFQNSNQVAGMSLQEFFNGGDPVELFFAPITFDSLTPAGGALYEMGGPCVNSNISDAFSVIYLNETEISDISASDSSGTCTGSFRVTGGLPEWNQTNYNIYIENTDNPNINYNISNTSHDEVVNFPVTVAGMYTITITDGKNCPATETINFSCSGIPLSLTDNTVEVGMNTCVPVTVENFVNIITITLTIRWNPTILDFDDLQNINLPNFTGTTTNVNQNEGYMTMVWLSDDLNNGTTLPDGTTLFEICFDAIGSPGEVSPVYFSDNPTSLEFTDDNSNEIPVILTNGSVTITSPPTLYAEVATCGSLPNPPQGEIIVTAFSGTAPYTVTYTNTSMPAITGSGIIGLDGGSTSFMGLPAGNYDIVVTDDAGDTYTLSDITISDSPPPTVTTITTPPSCSYRSDGEIELVNIMADSPYTIQWSNNEFNITSISDLSNGIYRYTITDAQGCSQEGSASLNTTPITTSISTTNATCLGLADGGVLIQPSGGTPSPGGLYNYRYRYSAPGHSAVNIPNQSELNLTNSLEPGTYYTTVSDARNCEFRDTFTVDADKEVVYEDLMIDSILCFGDSAVISIDAGISMGMESEPYVFIWSPNIPSINGPGGTNITQPVPAGTYQLLIRDGEGCERRDTFEIKQPNEFIVSISKIVHESCPIGGDGSLTAGVSGGTPPYNFLWETGTMGFTISGLDAGTYSVTATDAHGCTDSVSATVLEPQAAVIDSFSIDSITCAGSSDGSVTIFYTDTGSMVTSIRWSDPDNTTGPVLSGISAGTYYVTLTNQDSCVTVDSVTLSDPVPMNLVDTMISYPTCVGDADGSISLVVTGGNTPYNYIWEGGISTSATATDLSQGTYNVTIEDALGCEAITVEIDLEDPNALEVSFSNQTATSCYNTCDAATTALGSGGSGGPYLYTWSSNEATANATQLCPGVNFVTVSDGTCAITDSIIISSPDSIKGVIIEREDVSCFGATDGSIEISATGGVAPFSFEWETGDMSPDLDLQPARVYDVTITDANDCMAFESYTISEPPPLTLSAEVDGITCGNDQDGMIIITPSGGVSSDYTFMWNIAGSGDDSIQSGLGPGSYSVVVKDQNGCTADTTITLDVPPPISAVLADVNDVLCPGGAVPFTVLSASGGSGSNYTYTLNNNLEFMIGENVDIPAGEYLVSILDGSGCSFDTTITIGEPLPIAVDAGPDVTVNLGDSIQLNGLAESLAGIDSVFWTPSDSLSCTFCYDPVGMPVQTTEYTFHVIDNNGCTAQDAVLVVVDNRRQLYIPNAFSPDNDGINDIWEIYPGHSVSAIPSMIVFDRWGNRVFYRKDLPVSPSGSGGWDGTFNGELMAPGVFVYMVEVEFFDGSIILYQGNIHLIR